MSDSIGPSSRFKLIASVFLLVIAGVLWIYRSGEARSLRQQSAEALIGVEFRLECSACGETSEIAAPEYVLEAGPEGVQCPHCGQQTALRDGEVGDDYEQFRDEMLQITSVSEIRDALVVAEDELKRIEQAFQAEQAQGDSFGLRELRRERNRQRARIQAIHWRWSDLQM